jgi:hypothetical protein
MRSRCGSSPTRSSTTTRTTARSSAEVDRTLRRELGASPLVPAVDAEGGGGAVTALVLESRDPARDLAWALMNGSPRRRPRARDTLVETIVAEFNQADEHAKTKSEPKSESAAVREAAAGRAPRREGGGEGREPA